MFKKRRDFMAEDTFTKVIEIEKEIKEIISEERKRVDQWVESVKKELAVQYRHEMKRLKEELTRNREEKITEAEERISERLNSAREMTRKFEEIDDRELMPILENFLQRIVPGKDS